MIAVIFEVSPRDGSRQAYLDLAATLTPLLSRIDGFVAVERFESLTNPGKLLSLSWWRDEAAIRQWRADARHQAAQEHGRADLFSEYRLCVGRIIREYGMSDRAEVPPDHD